MSSTVDTFDDTILSNLQGDWSRQGAEDVLSLAFSEDQKNRMHELAEKARSGEMSEAEREEAASFERISSLLGILQSKARIALRNSKS